MTDFLNVLLLSFSPQGTLSQVSSPGQDESPFFFKPPFEHDRIRPRMLPGYVSDTKKKKKMAIGAKKSPSFSQGQSYFISQIPAYARAVSL